LRADRNSPGLRLSEPVHVHDFRGHQRLNSFVRRRCSDADPSRFAAASLLDSCLTQARCREERVPYFGFQKTGIRPPT
jgi:hypothetical protein